MSTVHDNSTIIPTPSPRWDSIYAFLILPLPWVLLLICAAVFYTAFFGNRSQLDTLISKRVTQMEGNYASLAKKVDEQNNQHIRSEGGNTGAELIALRQELQAHKTTMQESLTNIRQGLVQENKWNDTVAQLNQSIAELRAKDRKLQNLETTLGQCTASLQAINTKLSGYATSLQSMEAVKKTIQQAEQAGGLSKQLADIRLAVTTITERVAAAQQAIISKAAKSDVEDLNNKVAPLARGLNGEQSARNRLESRLQAEETARSNLETRMNAGLEALKRELFGKMEEAAANRCRGSVLVLGLNSQNLPLNVYNKTFKQVFADQVDAVLNTMPDYRLGLTLFEGDGHSAIVKLEDRFKNGNDLLEKWTTFGQPGPGTTDRLSQPVSQYVREQLKLAKGATRRCVIVGSTACRPVRKEDEALWKGISTHVILLGCAGSKPSEERKKEWEAFCRKQGGTLTIYDALPLSEGTDPGALALLDTTLRLLTQPLGQPIPGERQP
jgi:hypothetical protein